MKRIIFTLIVVGIIIGLGYLGGSTMYGEKKGKLSETEMKNNQEVFKQEISEKKNDYAKMELKKIYLAGGCFWGVEAYMERIDGIADAVSGYANGNTENPKYEDLVYGNSGHAETVEVSYAPDIITLREVLLYYFRIIDPISINQQGNDKGIQYRTGIYYENEEDKAIIESFLKEEQKKYKDKIAVEALPLQQFTKAEEYHQDYLQKNPNGYCHIDLHRATEPVVDSAKYPKISDEKLKKDLTDIQYRVTQLNDTERPFTNEYWDSEEVGIYVDITTGEPLFASADKFQSGCGWPSFSKPIEKDVVAYQKDESHGMDRTEVRSRTGNAHLGHVFEDGPKETGGLRYCINSASLRFIPLNKMEEEGYGYLINFVKKEKK